MILLSLLWTCSVISHSIDSEILQLEDSLRLFSLARAKLQTASQMTELSPLSAPVNPEDWLLNKVIPRGLISLSKSAISVQFLTLKPIGQYRDVVNSQNIVLVVSYSDGTLEVLQTNGHLLCSYDLKYPAKLIATTTNYDEVKIAVVSPSQTLEIFELFMEKKKNDSELGAMQFELRLVSNDEIVANGPTALIYYVKTGKKYWVLGDSAGVLSMHLMNGTLFKQTEIGFGGINSLERFGQTLVFSTHMSVGVIHPVTLELQQMCGGLIEVHDICIDTMSSSALVYALSDEKLVMLDTKHQEGNESICKCKQICSNCFEKTGFAQSYTNGLCEELYCDVGRWRSTLL